MTIEFLPTATKATLEAVHMAKINPPKPQTLQEMEEAEMSAMHKALVGGPVRIEFPLESVMQAREYIRAVRAALDRCDAVLTEHIQNPPPTTGRNRVLDWMVLSQIKSIIRVAQKMTPTRSGGRRKVK